MPACHPENITCIRQRVRRGGEDKPQCSGAYYQRARAAGLNHEGAVNLAWLQAGVAGAVASAMGALGGPGKAVEQTVKQKIGQVLADIFVKAPLIGAAGQAVQAKIEGKDLHWVDLGPGSMLGPATGAIIVGGHKLI